MSLVRRVPMTEFDAIERRMRRLFDEVGFAQAPLPAADVYETDEEYVVELEVPGYAEKELTVEVFDHVLAVKGEQETTTHEKTKQFRLQERLERTFERRFTLPGEVDTGHLKASYTEGVLEVHAPKAPTAKPTKVAITKE